MKAAVRGNVIPLGIVLNMPKRSGEKDSDVLRSSFTSRTRRAATFGEKPLLFTCGGLGVWSVGTPQKNRYLQEQINKVKLKLV